MSEKPSTPAGVSSRVVYEVTSPKRTFPALVLATTIHGLIIASQSLGRGIVFFAKHMATTMIFIMTIGMMTIAFFDDTLTPLQTGRLVGGAFACWAMMVPKVLFYLEENWDSLTENIAMNLNTARFYCEDCYVSMHDFIQNNSAFRHNTNREHEGDDGSTIQKGD